MCDQSKQNDGEVAVEIMDLDVAGIITDVVKNALKVMNIGKDRLKIS